MRSSKIFIGIFLIICLVPSLFMFFVHTKSAANEILAPAPKFGESVLSGTADFIGDRFAFRQEFASVWAWLNAKLFNTSVEEKVVLGNEGNLYYASDFVEKLSEDELEAIAENLAALQTELEAEGREFIFTIAPDKSSLHGEFLPQGWKSPQNGRALEPFLQKHGVNYVSLFDEAIPYFETDSHWTGFGAAMVCDKLAGTDYAKREFSSAPGHKGDLYEMLYPAGKRTEPDTRLELEYESKGSTNNGNAITIETVSSGDGKLFCWRDSFGVSLFPYLADAYESATFSRETDFSADKTGDADTVILEIVERNLGNLK